MGNMWSIALPYENKEKKSPLLKMFRLIFLMQVLSRMHFGRPKRKKEVKERIVNNEKFREATVGIYYVS